MTPSCSWMVRISLSGEPIRSSSIVCSSKCLSLSNGLEPPTAIIIKSECFSAFFNLSCGSSVISRSVTNNPSPYFSVSSLTQLCWDFVTLHFFIFFTCSYLALILLSRVMESGVFLSHSGNIILSLDAFSHSPACPKAK